MRLISNKNANLYSSGYKDEYPSGYPFAMGETGNKKTAHKDPLVQQYATDLGANLRRLRKGQGLSQERLGLMIGSWHSRISNIERGKVIVSFPDAVKLCRALGADPEELIDLSTLTLADYPEPADGHAPL